MYTAPNAPSAHQAEKFPDTLTIMTPGSNAPPAATKRKTFKLDELEALCRERGYDINFNSYQGVFTLSKTGSKEWVWIINPETERIVSALRALNRDEWRDVLNYNILRLDEQLKKVATDND